MDKNSTFQKKMVEYLEGVHIGKFLNGPHQQVQQKVSNNMIQSDYISPTETLLLPPPPKCKRQTACGICAECIAITHWHEQYESTVDDLLLRSNIHTCQGGPKEYKKKADRDRGKSKNIREKYSGGHESLHTPVFGKH